MAVFDPFQQEPTASKVFDPFAAPVAPVRGIADFSEASLASDMGAAFKQGLFGVAPAMVGGAMKALSPVGSGVYKSGEDLQDAGKSIAALPELQQSGTERGLIGETLVAGAGGVGQMAPVMAASLLNPVAGATMAAGMYGGSTYQDTKERSLKQEGLDDVYAAANPDDPRVVKAKGTALASGAIQGAGDAAMTYLGGRFLRGTFPKFGTQTAEGIVQAAAKPGATAVKDFGKAWGAQMLGEGVTEALQDEGQAAVERMAGLKDAPAFLAQAAESAKGGVGTALLLGPLAGPGHYKKFRDNAEIQRALADPSAPSDVRESAALILASEIGKTDADAARNFTYHAIDAIGNQAETGSDPYGLNLNDTKLLQPFTSQPEDQAGATDGTTATEATGGVLQDSPRAIAVPDPGVAPISAPAVGGGVPPATVFEPPVPTGALSRAVSDAGLLPSATPETIQPTELDLAIAHNNGPGGHRLMQNRGVSDGQYHASLIQQFRNSQGSIDNAAQNNLPEVPGSATLERPGVGVPALQEQAPGRVAAGGDVGDVGAGFKPAPTIPAPDASTQRRVAMLEQEKASLLEQSRGQGITAGLAQAPAVTARPTKINTEIQRLQHPAPPAPAAKRPAITLPDTGKDNLLAAVTKLGGVNHKEFRNASGYGTRDIHDKAALNGLNDLAKKESKSFGIAVRHGGQSLDGMRQTLVEQGYLPAESTTSDPVSKLIESHGGNHAYSIQYDNAGEAAYAAEQDRYAATIEGMTDEEYDAYSRNQWLEEQAALLHDAETVIDDYLAEQSDTHMNAADWQALESEFKEALDATEFRTDTAGQAESQVQAPATGTTEGVSEFVPGDAEDQTATAKGEGNPRWRAQRQRYLTKKIAEAQNAKERARLQKILDGLKPQETKQPVDIAATKTVETSPESDTIDYSDPEEYSVGGNYHARLASRKQRESFTGTIKEAADVTGGIRRVIRKTPQKGWSTRDAAAVKRAEATALEQWATENNLLLPDGPIVAQWQQQGEKHGTEHKVYSRPASNQIVKFTPAAANETWQDYLLRLATHNSEFSAAHYTLEGFTVINGDLHAVVTQPYIEENDAGTKARPDDIATMLEDAGYVRRRHPVQEFFKQDDPHGDQFYNPKTGIVLEDVQPNNVIIIPEGNAVIFDAVIRHEPPGQTFEAVVREKQEIKRSGSAADVEQAALFPTPATFGKKPQPKTTQGDVATSDLVDSFISTESVQPPLAEATPATSGPSSTYGANNKLVTGDRAAILREKLKAKFDNQINSGIDPEMLAMGTELAIFHIEAGVREFTAFAKAISEDIGVPVQRLREYLRGWYNGARDTIEDKGLSIEGMDDSAVVREAHKALFEEKPAVKPRSPQAKDKHQQMLERLLSKAKTEQGRANWLQKLEAYKQKAQQNETVIDTAATIPENWQQQDNKVAATFSKGDRVQAANGQHGTISDVHSYTVTSGLIDITRGGVGVTERKTEHRHSYTALMDNGVKQSLYSFQPETDPAPEVVPAPRFAGKAVDPQRLLDDIKGDKDTAANNRSAASRAKKASSIKIYNDKVELYTKNAVDKQAAFDAWALEYPAEAIKYQKTAEIVALPSATEATGTDVTPAKRRMEIKETVHTKKGHKLFIVKMFDRIERDEYDKLNRDAKRTGNGWDNWSKGFQFLDRESAESFVEKWSGAKPEPVAVATGPKVEYHAFMQDVYHTMEENGMLQEHARSVNREQFVKDYRDAYVVAVRSEKELHEKRGEDVAETAASAIKNDLADLADRYFDRAREKKPADKLTSNQEKTIRDLGPVGTRVQFTTGFNKDVFEIDSIEPEYGRVHVRGDRKNIYRNASEYELATPADSSIIVNEKKQTQEGPTDEIRPTVESAATVGESGRVGTTATSGTTGRAPGGRTGNLQPAGKRNGQTDGGGLTGQSDTTPADAKSKHGSNDGQGSSVKRHDGVLEVVPVDFRITDEHNIGKGGAKQKARDNIAAIRLLKQITAEERGATPEEQAVLVKYVDWGMSELANNIFENTGYNPATRASSWFKEGWENLGAELKSLLSPEEYASAKKSTMSAFYTPIPIYQAMHAAAEQMGFTGGRILVPGSGLLHEAGTLPDSFLKNSRITGVELNPVSAAISKLLYPSHDIRHQGFEKFVMPDGFYDMAFGNPPFVDMDVTSDPLYAKHKFKLHDYFFAKAIDKVRPGGLLMFITSKGTMDKANDKARAFLAERADLLGAIRLPESAFKENAGTETVTDVIFLRKRTKGEAPGGQAWGDLKAVTTPDGVTHINEYFADNPQMVLGTNAITSSQFGPKYTVLPLKGTELSEQFRFAVKTYLPEKVYSKEKTESPADRPTVEFDLSPGSVKEGAFYLDKSGAVVSKENGVGVPTSKKGKDLEIIKSFIPLRDAVRQVLYVQIKGGDLTAAQKELKKQYSSFVKQHGVINLEKKISSMRNGVESVSTRAPNFSPFRDDPDSYLVASIEKFDDVTNSATPGPIFTERTIKPESIPQIDSVHDALHVVMHEDGVVDIAKIADHMNVTEAQAIDALGSAIFHNPQTAQWETDDEYLSGNVKQKLVLAESSAQADKSFERNVEALKAVQPADLPPSRISLGLGEPILKPEHIQQFAAEVINLGIRVSHLKMTGDWGVEKVSGYQTVEATSEWGTPRRPAHELISDALNSRQIRIESYVTDADGKETKVFDKDATNAANEKLSKIKERFAAWVWEHPGRSEELARSYNDAYNNSVKRVYGGDHINKMTFPGMSAVVAPHEHQKRVAWRIVQSGNTYMAHSVGAGKTIASILAGMELKRLGIKKKPSYVVPNHMLKQFASEFLQLYPAAKIIVADETQFSKENRNRFMGRVAAENWDAVIMTHSAFGKMQVSPEFSSQFIQEQIDELEWALSDTDKGDRLKRKQIERAKARLEQRLEKVLNATDKDKGVTFEETGIDQIFVDEAHEFRKLDFITNQTNIKGIDPNGSLMSFDLYVKSRYLEKLYPNRSLVLMSGTAITNTIGEIFTIQRFLQEKKLQELGLDNFDAWSSTFGDLVTKLEATPAGNYKPVTRFAKFKNLSSLSQLWSEVGDFIHARDLTYIKRPSVKSGGRIIVTGELSPAQAAYKQSLADRIKAIERRKGPPKKGDDILLSVITDGRHAALDERYIGSVSRPSADNKLEKMVSDVAGIWKDTRKDKLTQMIFCDLGMPGSEERRGFSAYNQIKASLIKQGVPAAEIAFMQDYKKSDEKIKLFRAMNEGKVRVLIGSSEAMGTGVNAQKLLVALHHLDPDTYLPSNIEQREGRIVRQGNSNDEVQLYTYVTKGSYDETMWQFLETKQRFIDQFLSGESTVDESTDVDGGADSFAMARAMSSDNPLILERAGIESDIQRLESLRRGYFDDQQRLKSNVSRAEDNMPHYRRELAALDKVIARRVDTAGDKFALVVGARSFDERKKAGEALVKSMDKMLTAGDEQEWHKVGEVAGLDIMARSGISIKIPWLNLSVGAAGTYSHPIIFQGLESTNDLDAVGLSMKLENLARSFDKNLAGVQEQAAKDEKLLKDSKDRIGRPFEHAATLEEKRNRLNEIEKILQAEERQAEAGNDTDGPKLSLADGDVVGITADKARAAIAPLLAKWKNAPSVEVVQTVDEMPEGLRDQLYSLGAENEVRGVFDEGRVYLVASNLRNGQEAIETVLHETVGHYGIRSVVGKNLNIVLSQIAHSANKAAMAEIAERYGYDLKNREDLLAAAEEYLADMAQNPEKHPALLARAIAVVRNWLREMGLDLSWTDADIRALLAQAQGFVERGKSGSPAVFDGTRLMVAAWHGSPHDHDKFSTEKIGTGEGAQVYGWGLYFAGAKEVAEYYRNTLSRGNAMNNEDLAKFFTPGNIVPSYGGQDRVVRFSPQEGNNSWFVEVYAVDKTGERLYGPEGKNRIHFTEPSKANYEKVTGEKLKVGGRLYHVELAPDEDEYLLWDKPLSEQSEKVKAAIRDAYDAKRKEFRNGDYNNPQLAEEVARLRQMADELNVGESGVGLYEITGAKAYHSISSGLGADAQAASEYLHSLGIRGIKYLDGTSRGQGDGNYNYVIFNDADISIKAKLSLRKTGASVVAEAQAAYNEATASDIFKSVTRLLNPLDWSRMREGFERLTPDAIKDALGWFFANPVYQAERDPRKQQFVDTAIEREENKIGFQLRFMGWDGQQKAESTFLSRMKDTYTTWGESDKATAWGRIQEENRLLSRADQEAVNVLLVEGDKRSKAYTSLDKAMLNTAIAAAKPSEAAFKVYKSVRNHIDTVVANEREKIFTEMSRKAGVEEATIKRHISDYRQALSERPGWLPRNHGEGKHQINVYQVIKDLKFEIKSVKTEAHGDNSSQAYLPYYAGPQVTDKLTDIVERINDKYNENDREQRIKFGAYINGKALTANGQLIVTGSREDIARFLKEAATVIPAVIESNKQRLVDLQAERAKKEKDGASQAELREIDSQIKAASDTRVRVKTFMQMHESQAAAEKVLKGVTAEMASAMPTNYRPSETYETEYRVADGMSESAFGDLQGDFAMERAQMEALKRATQSGEITAEEAKALRNKIIQSSAEVLMGRGAGRHQIQRAPYLIEGYATDNAIGMYHDYMTATAGMLSKAEYAKEQFENFRYAPAAVKPWAEQYIKDSLRNMGLADRISGNARAVASFWYLGFKASSILVNGTQVYTLGVAELGRRTKQNSVKAIAKAQVDIIKGNLSAAEKDLFNSKIWKLQEMETAVHEISGEHEGITGALSAGFHQLANKAMMPFQEMEMLNRKTMILAAYRSGLADRMSTADAIEFALDVNRKTNFEMSRANLPGWARNPLGRTGYALQSFVWNNWNWVYNRATSGEKADMIALLKYGAMLTAFGGVAALAGGDEADKLLRRLTGKSYKLEMEKWTRAHAKEYGTVGELLNAAVWHGGMGALGVNISNAMRLNIPLSGVITGESSASDSAMGVFSGLIDKGKRTAQFAAQGQFARAAEAAAPAALSAPMTAYRMATKGATTTHGKPVFDETGNPLKYSGLDATKRALGFQPLGQSQRMEASMATTKAIAFWNERRGDLLDGVRLARNPEEKRAAQADIWRFNREVRESQAWPKVNIISSESITRAKQAKPDRKKLETERNNN